MTKLAFILIGVALAIAAQWSPWPLATFAVGISCVFAGPIWIGALHAHSVHSGHQKCGDGPGGGSGE